MYRSYYPHRSRELVSPVCGIFFVWIDILWYGINGYLLANIYFLVQLITFLTKYTIFHDLYFSATNVYFWRIGTFLLKNKFFLAHIGSLRHSCIVNHTNGSVVFYVEKLFFSGICECNLTSSDGATLLASLSFGQSAGREVH